MKKIHIMFLLVFLILGFSLLYPELSRAGIDLPWSTTFSCPSQAQDGSISSQPTWVTCDGMGKYGGWMDTGYPESILPGANNPIGGGSGQRHWIGDGLHFGSGSIKITLNAPQREFWIRYYAKYQQGFNWGTGSIGMKLIYLDPGTTWEVYSGYTGIDYFFYHQSGGSSICAGPPAPVSCSAKGTGWNNVMRSGAINPSTLFHESDGFWHQYEWHFKADTNGADGVLEIWSDELLILSVNNVNFNNHAWQNIIIPENANYPLNASGPIGTAEAFMDIDDVAISATGYIGPLPGAVGPSPAPPQGLTIK